MLVCPHDGGFAVCLLHHRGQRAAVIMAAWRHCGGEKLAKRNVVVGLVFVSVAMDGSC